MVWVMFSLEMVCGNLIFLELGISWWDFFGELLGCGLLFFFSSWVVENFMNGSSLRISRISSSWWFGDPRPLRKTHPNPSLSRVQSFLGIFISRWTQPKPFRGPSVSHVVNALLRRRSPWNSMATPVWLRRWWCRVLNRQTVSRFHPRNRLVVVNYSYSHL